MSNLIRVSDNLTGHHYTIPQTGFDEARHQLVTHDTDPAVDRDGRPRPPKFLTTQPTAKAKEAKK